MTGTFYGDGGDEDKQVVLSLTLNFNFHWDRRYDLIIVITADIQF